LLPLHLNIALLPIILKDISKDIAIFCAFSKPRRR
jgi:hypothetical protein